MDFLAGGAGQAALTGWLMWKRVGILLMMAESRSWGRLVAPITITCVTPRDTTETSAGKHPQAGNVSTSHGISLTLSKKLQKAVISARAAGESLEPQIPPTGRFLHEPNLKIQTLRRNLKLLLVMSLLVPGGIQKAMFQEDV